MGEGLVINKGTPFKLGNAYSRSAAREWQPHASTANKSQIRPVILTQTSKTSTIKFYIPNMKKIIFALVILAICIVYAQVAKGSGRKISADEAHKMIGELKDFILLDVRTEKEFKEKRIEGAILIPDFEIKNRAVKELNDKNQVILVYCRSGRRSASAAAELVRMGYMNVYDFGGILDWKYETVVE